MNIFERIRSRGPRALSALARSMFQSPPSKGHVLMLHNGRSGSTLLGDMLDQHDEIFWDGETIEKQLHRIEARRQVGFENLWGEIDLDRGVEEIAERMRKRAGGKIFGTEVQDYHVLMMGTDIRQFIRRLKALGFTRFVFLERNYMRKIASTVVATKRGKFHLKSGQRLKRTKVRINPERVYIGHRFRTLKQVLNQYRDFRTAALDELRHDKLLHLQYEKDIKFGPEVAARRACEFLDLPLHEPDINFRKTTNVPLGDVIENIEEVQEAFVEHGYETEILGSDRIV